MRNRVSITLAAYFPLPFIGLALLMLLAVAIGLAERYGPVSFLLIPAGGFLFTARYRLTINLVAQTYHDHLWIVGMKKGAKVNFNRIDGLHLTQNAYRQTISSWASSMTKRGTEYNGFIRFDEEDIQVINDTSKRAVMKKLVNLQRALRGNIVSSTTVVIDCHITDHTDQ
ncbi:MAG: hypothetical protein WA960_18385 [Tunicatimonas sp.]